MTSELERRIAQSAPSPTRPVDARGVWERARQRRHRRASAVSAGMASLVLLAGAALVASEPPAPQPVVDQPADIDVDEPAPAEEEPDEPAPVADEQDRTEDEPAVVTQPEGETEDDADVEPDPGPSDEESDQRADRNQVTVLVSEATVPDGESALTFADIATDPDGAAEGWQRFGLGGEPHRVDFDESLLLFVGFGESGSCPEELDGLDSDPDRVRVGFGLEGVDEDGEVGCTDDYNPRTFVLKVGRTMMPAEGFVLEVDRRQTTHARSFVLSATSTTQPPAGPAMSGMHTREEPDLSLTAQPATTTAGDPTRLALANHGDVSAHHSDAGFSSGRDALRRWAGQRWLPAPGQGPYEPHPSLTFEGADVEPGEQASIATVDTTELPPGWYRVDVTVGLGGSGGHVDVGAPFRVDAG
jgi:hypothetical protein